MPTQLTYPQIPINTARQPDIYGVRPRSTALPDPLRNIQMALPAYNQLTSQFGSNILGNLQGQMSPAFMDAVTNSLNARAVGGGVGGSPFANNTIALGLGREAQARQDLGAQQLLAALPTYSQVATLNPAIEADINRWNQVIASAPDPQARQQADLALQNQIIAQTAKARQADELRQAQMRQRDIALAGRRGSGTTPASFSAGGLIGGIPGGSFNFGVPAPRLPASTGFPAYNNQVFSGTRPEGEPVPIGVGQAVPTTGGGGNFNLQSILQGANIDWAPYT